MKIWAHRGNSFDSAENTMDAFKLAISEEVDGIELDVQLTKDGKVVVCHDETINRVSNGKGLLKDYTLKELKQFNFSKTPGKIERIPTLEEVLKLINNKPITLNIELKNSFYAYEGMEQKVIDLVHKYNVDVVYSSFNHYSMLKIKELDPNAKTGLLYDACIVNPAKYANSLKADYLHPSINCLLLSNPKDYKDIPINVWTVNTKYPKLKEYNINACITNFPTYLQIIEATKWS